MNDYIAISILVLIIALAGYVVYLYRYLFHHDLDLLAEDDEKKPVDFEHDDAYITIEYGGGLIRMTNWEYEHVWPTMTREQKRAQIRPVDEKDRVQVEVNGEMVYTNREGSSSAAKEQEKRVVDAANRTGGKFTSPKRRRKA